MYIYIYIYIYICIGLWLPSSSLRGFSSPSTVAPRLPSTFRFEASVRLVALCGKLANKSVCPKIIPSARPASLRWAVDKWGCTTTNTKYCQY